VRDESGAFRVITLATLPEAIYLLHAFQKKTQHTARGDIELAARRFRQVNGSTGETQRTANNANGPVAACGTVTLLACWGGEARRCRLVTAAFAFFAFFAFFALNLAAAACQP
jgi:hypothetical protein